MAKRCFICGHKNNDSGNCTSTTCPRDVAETTTADSTTTTTTTTDA